MAWNSVISTIKCRHFRLTLNSCLSCWIETGADANTVIMKATGAKYRIEDNIILSPTQGLSASNENHFVMSQSQESSQPDLSLQIMQNWNILIELHRYHASDNSVITNMLNFLSDSVPTQNLPAILPDPILHQSIK